MGESGRSSALEAYIAGLPEGLDSHPECLAKASMCRSALEAEPLPAEVVDALPGPLRTIAEHPPPVSSWIPEVHSRAVMLAIYDTHFGDPAKFDTWAYARQRALFQGPLYAVALQGLSPRMLIKSMPSRWTMFHKGTDTEVVELEEGHGVLRFDHPQGIYDAVSRVGLCAGLRAGLDVCLGASPRATVEVRESSPLHAILDARWSGSGAVA